MNRRKFLTNVAKGTSAAIGLQVLPSRVLGRGGIAPSGKVNMAMIGTGLISRGHRMDFTSNPATQMMALCELNRPKMEGVKKELDNVAKKRKDAAFRPIDMHEHYEELLDRDDIDAVCICTPDHWHVAIALMAIQKGKAVYVEKPLSLTVEEGRLLSDAVKKYKGVLQVGSQQRSEWAFRRAAELVRNGYIGQVDKIVTRIGNDFPVADYALPEIAVPDGFNYEKWLGQARWMPYTKNVAFSSYGGGWRSYFEFGQRKEGDWGAHHFDIIQWALDKDNSGPNLIVPFNKETNEDSYFQYENGPKVIYKKEAMKPYMIEFIGSEGTIGVSRGQQIGCTVKGILNHPMKSSDVRLQVSNSHRGDFLDAVRFGHKNICTAEVGHRSATICALCAIATREQKAIKWDPKNEKILDDAKLSPQVSRPRRSPYFLGA